MLREHLRKQWEFFIDQTQHQRAIPTFLTRPPLLRMRSHFVQIKEIKPNKWLHE